ncbi:MAG TPA: DPP IV N-terminal domain-containing protein [Fimbriiglobus sp.]|nr:DPP IV N-terminal domain-containing protein [Fimbriiglobus sp.]
MSPSASWPVARWFVHLGLVAAFVTLATIAPAADPQKVTGANYPLAMKFSREFVAQHVPEGGSSLVSPRWLGKTDVFWYEIRTPAGVRYWKVDCEKKSRVPLLDTGTLAARLSELSRKPTDEATLKLASESVTDDGAKFRFVAGEFRYEYDLAAKKLTKLGRAPRGPQLPPEALAQMTQEQRDRLREIQQRRRDDDRQDDQQQEQQEGTPPPASRRTAAPSYKAYAPDKKKYVYAYKYNLYLAEEGKEDKAVQLTSDGAAEYSFAGGGFGFGGTRRSDGDPQPPAPERKSLPRVTWSVDSKYFHVTRTDGRGVKDLFLVNSIATPRPRLETYKYPMPGEEAVRKPELYVCHADGCKVVRVTPKWTDESYSDVHWDKKAPDVLRFVRRDRLLRHLEVCSLNISTGQEKCLFAEGFDAAYLDFQSPRYVEETGEMIWWSERSGWGHFYLYGHDGKLLNPITSGDWRSSRIVDVDAKDRTLYFVGNARELGENIYNYHLYRVKLDGTGLTLLTPGNGTHSITGGGGSGRRGGRFTPGTARPSALSPSRKYVVDNYSRVDQSPVAVLRDDSGKELMKLEQTDLTALRKTGWKPPETFIVKAADGTTDLYGNMWKPFDFDSAKKYPIICYVYPGPQQEGVTHSFAAYSSYMQLAQLGFIVIQVGHRGGTPERSKAYHSYGYFNLRDYGLADKKAAIEELAARHPYIDLDRVGIYGHSGGGFMSAAAVLQKPYNEFFKAAVASSGNHDNNIYNNSWSERYHGLKEVAATEGEQKSAGTGARTGGRTRTRRPPDDRQDRVADLEKQIAEVTRKLAALKGGSASQKKATLKTHFEIKVPTNTELAANLKGHLLLVHGEIDNNVHPANTMRLVDALIKANKRFEMLIIPGARHGYGPAQPYFTQRMWDFFAEHLLDDRQTRADILDKDVKRK